MLLRYLKIDVRRAFGNWRFPICVIIISVLLLYNKDEPSHDRAQWFAHDALSRRCAARFRPQRLRARVGEALRVRPPHFQRRRSHPVR